MGLLKCRQKPNRARKVDPSNAGPTSICYRLRRRFGKTHRQESDIDPIQQVSSEDGSVNPTITSPPTHSNDLPASQSLWDCAYVALREEEAQLVKDYEELLSKDARSELKDDPSMQVVATDGISHDTDQLSQKDQLDATIAKGLSRVEIDKTEYTIAGHRFVLSEQIAQATQLILWAKDWIGEAVKQSPEASIVWAGVCMILPLLTNPTIADDANRDGFTYVTTRMRYYVELQPLVQQLGENPDVPYGLMKEVRSNIVTLYRHIIEFQIRSVLRFYKSSLERYLGDLLPKDWQQLKLAIEKIERTVDGMMSQINQFTSSKTHKSLDATSQNALQTVQQFLSVSQQQLHIQTRLLEIQEDEVKQKPTDKQNKCHQLFRLTSSDKDATYDWYKDRVEDRLDGTCEWFLQHENFRKWLGQDSGPLLVSADPGCGKSVLAKYLIDHVLPQPPTTGLPRPPTTICYFFFKDQDQNTMRQALCALLHQLFSSKQSLLEHAVPQFDKDGPGLVNSTSSLWTILENAVKDPRAGPLIMVLDALDECAELELEGLMRHLKTHSRIGGLKYLFTSRPYDNIVSKFQNFLDTLPYVRIPGEQDSESEIISREVNHVIKHRVEKLAKEKGLSDEVKDRLGEHLLRVPHRTYLWVYLVFDYLETEHFKKTEKGVDAAVATLPNSIDQAYERILSKSKDHPMVGMALRIILGASRPLTVSEMNVAINVQAAKSFSDLDLEGDEDFKLRLRSWCGLFISIHHDKIYFLHQTAREFLLPLQSPSVISSGVRWQHSITARDAHRVLAKVCVFYLDFFNSEDVLIHRRGDFYGELEDPGSYTFLDYSANNWADHFREACFDENDVVILPAFTLSDPHSRSCLIWSECITSHHRFGPNLRPNFYSSLSISSSQGHEVLVRLLLEKGVDIEDRGKSHENTPLEWAVIKGHEAIVRLLLGKGAHPDGKRTGRDTPLPRAIVQHDIAIAQLLLENGADIELKDDERRTPLATAAKYGEKEFVQLLLEKGADLESKDQDGRTPLSIAAQYGRTEIVQLLLEKGADIKSRDGCGGTSLNYAAGNDHKDIVRLLEDRSRLLYKNEYYK